MHYRLPPARERRRRQTDSSPQGSKHSGSVRLPCGGWRWRGSGAVSRLCAVWGRERQAAGGVAVERAARSEGRAGPGRRRVGPGEGSIGREPRRSWVGWRGFARAIRLRRMDDFSPKWTKFRPDDACTRRSSDRWPVVTGIPPTSMRPIVLHGQMGGAVARNCPRVGDVAARAPTPAASAMIESWGLTAGQEGMIEPSATQTPSTPRRRPAGSTGWGPGSAPAAVPGPRAAVPRRPAAVPGPPRVDFVPAAGTNSPSGGGGQAARRLHLTPGCVRDPGQRACAMLIAR